MTPEQEAAIQSHIQGIAKILYENTPAEQLETLEGIETAIRAHLLDTVGPKLALFLSVAVQEQRSWRSRKLKSCVGILRVSDLERTSGRSPSNSSSSSSRYPVPPQKEQVSES